MEESKNFIPTVAKQVQIEQLKFTNKNKYSLIIALFESHSWKSTKLKSTNPHSTIPLIEIQIQKYSCYLGLKVKMKRGRGLCVKPNISHFILIFVQYFCGVYTEIQKYSCWLCAPRMKKRVNGGGGETNFQDVCGTQHLSFYPYFLALLWEQIDFSVLDWSL